MAATATAVKILTFLQLATQALSGRDAEGNKGFSRIVVASPGMRKYTYNIAHDPEGRDFSIDFNPLDTEVDMHPFEDDQQGFQQSHREYRLQSGFGTAKDGVQLKVTTPSYKEKRKIDKEIKSVYSSISKRPAKTKTNQAGTNFEDFDLGLMGYGDFMDPPNDYEIGAVPKPFPIRNNFSPVTHDTTSNLNLKKIKIPEIKLPHLKETKLTLPKLHLKKLKKKKKEEVQGLNAPRFEYGFAPVHPTPDFPTPLFTPSLDESRLKGLGEKAFSKIFMAQSLATPVQMFYPKGSYPADPNFSKNLFVPVYLAQPIADRSLHRFDPATFESQRIR